MSASNRDQAKRYLADHKIPQIFESLLSCLMMERPENPVEYIEKKMIEIKTIGPDQVNWETLVAHLHPYRDNIRRQFIRDGSLFDQEFAKMQGEIEEYRQRKKEHFESMATDDYQSDLFQLTEAHS